MVKIMQTIESDSAVVPFPATTADETQQNNYEPVRYNAMKHGILSRLAVLAHEDAGEFGDLLAALVEEHQPAGATEMHLVEELAAIIWRKRRVLLAEGANINQGLKGTECRRRDTGGCTFRAWVIRQGYRPARFDGHDTG